MGGFRFTLDFYGDTQVDRTLAALGDRVSDASEAWEAITDRFVAGQRRQFDTQGAAGGARWAPLSPAYAAQKARTHPGQPILQRDGDLVASLTRRPLGVEHITATSMVIGSDVEHGRYHQLGDGVPRRRPVELTEVTRRDWVKLLQRFITTGSTS